MQTSRGTCEPPESGTVPVVTHSSGDKPISLAVVEAVAAAAGRPPLRERSVDGGIEGDTLDPLYEAIDPDALDAICRPGDDRGAPAVTVTFAYCGYDVTVDGTGQITVSED